MSSTRRFPLPIRPLPIRPLVAALALCGLAACATPSNNALASAEGAPGSDAYAVSADEESSPLGLYLAGETALDQGESGPAAGLFARASAASPGQEALRERAFSTNLLAGRVKEAVRFAPLPGEGPASGVALGRLARGVDTLADGRGKEAQALLSDGAVGRALCGRRGAGRALGRRRGGGPEGRPGLARTPLQRQPDHRLRQPEPRPPARARGPRR